MDANRERQAWRDARRLWIVLRGYNAMAAPGAPRAVQWDLADPGHRKVCPSCLRDEANSLVLHTMPAGENVFAWMTAHRTRKGQQYTYLKATVKDCRG